MKLAKKMIDHNRMVDLMYPLMLPTLSMPWECLQGKKVIVDEHSVVTCAEMHDYGLINFWRQTFDFKPVLSNFGAYHE